MSYNFGRVVGDQSWMEVRQRLEEVGVRNEDEEEAVEKNARRE